MGGGRQQKTKNVATMEKGRKKNPSPWREGTTEVDVQAIITYNLLHCSNQNQQTSKTPQWLDLKMTPINTNVVYQHPHHT